MIPIRDDAPRITVPFVVWFLIAVNVAAFLYQVGMAADSPRAANALVASFGVVPARVSAVLGGNETLLAGLLPVVTSMFLHGGWMHLIGNMWFLWIFGDNVEDELGHGVFLLFYLVCGAVAATAQILSDPASTIPMVGASGAVAGVMGAYMMRFPRARVTILIPIFFFWTTFQLPAFLMLSYWLLVQFLSGSSSSVGGVAWWAHVGGFVGGLALVLLRPRRRVWVRTWWR